MKKLSIVIIVAFMVSCQSDKEDIRDALQVELNRFAEQTQIFEVNVDSAFVISGSQGTQVSFKQNSFIDKAGQPVTGEIVNLLHLTVQ